MNVLVVGGALAKPSAASTFRTWIPHGGGVKQGEKESAQFARDPRLRNVNLPFCQGSAHF
jgi:hypothetical protein